MRSERTLLIACVYSYESGVLPCELHKSLNINILYSVRSSGCILQVLLIIVNTLYSSLYSATGYCHKSILGIMRWHGVL